MVRNGGPRGYLGRKHWGFHVIIYRVQSAKKTKKTSHSDIFFLKKKRSDRVVTSSFGRPKALKKTYTFIIYVVFFF